MSEFNLNDYISDKRRTFMDTRNYCIECDKPKPCLCDLDNHVFDTTDYKVLKDGVRRVYKPCDIE